MPQWIQHVENVWSTFKAVFVSDVGDRGSHLELAADLKIV